MSPVSVMRVARLLKAGRCVSMVRKAGPLWQRGTQRKRRRLFAVRKLPCQSCFPACCLTAPSRQVPQNCVWYAHGGRLLPPHSSARTKKVQCEYHPGRSVCSAMPMSCSALCVVCAAGVRQHNASPLQTELAAAVYDGHEGGMAGRGVAGVWALQMCPRGARWLR